MSPADAFNLNEFKRTLWAIDRRGRYHFFIAHRPENHPNQQLVTSFEGNISVLWASGRLYENGPDCGGDLVKVLGGGPGCEASAKLAEMDARGVAP